MDISEIRKKLAGKGLKVTPQRMAILEAVFALKNHPTADNIIEFIRKHHPNIATGTVYKVLDALVEKGLIRKVLTDKDIMRYDAIMEKHHHLYSPESNRIEDYLDDELSAIIEKHFEKIDIPGFAVEDIRLQIIGKFKD